MPDTVYKGLVETRIGWTSSRKKSIFYVVWSRGMIKIAIYGKGGIGKSTITSNLAAAFAAMVSLLIDSCSFQMLEELPRLVPWLLCARRVAVASHS